MATILIGDPLLATPAFGVGTDFIGAPHQVVLPPSFAPGAAQPGLAEAEVLLTAHEMVTAEVMDAAANLRLIAKPGVGVDNIDVGAATARGVLVTNARGTRAQAVAEHALLLALSAARQIGAAHPSEAPLVAVELGGKTLGVLGYGDAGSRLARMGTGLGMRVAASTRTVPPGGVDDVEFVGLDELFARADVLAVCAPLTPETTHLVDERLLRLLPEDAVFVNVARGQIVVTDDLVRVLRSGHLVGAGLDVTDPEPLPSDHPLRSLPNVVLTGHVAGRTRESQRRAVEAMRTNVMALLDGKTPPDIVGAG